MGMDNPVAVKISFVLTAVWWAVFSIPILKNVRQNYYVETPPSKLIRTTFQNIGHTSKSIFHNRGIFFFILAYFCYIDGVGTVHSYVHLLAPIWGSIHRNDPLRCWSRRSSPSCSIWFGKLRRKPAPSV